MPSIDPARLFACGMVRVMLNKIRMIVMELGRDYGDSIYKRWVGNKLQFKWQVGEYGTGIHEISVNGPFGE